MSQGPQVRVSEDRRLLVDRLAASTYFNKSARLRDLLVYLTERVLEDEAVEIHEQEVGYRVFGRARDYDTAADNIVRVHASMLRKRLDQYFAAEGATEPTVIEIPRGNYAPVFRERPKEVAEAVVVAASVPGTPQLPTTRDWRLMLAVTCAFVFGVTTVVLLLREPPRPAAVSSSGPTVRQFWGQILRPDRVTDVVLDDAAVALYQELSGHAVSLNEYFDRSYLRRIPAAAEAAGLNSETATSIILRRQSSFADTSFMWKLMQAGRNLNAQPNLRFARDYSFRDLKANNAILLGNGRSNPWVQPFEAQLGIQWEFDRADGVYYPVDTKQPDRSFRPGKPGEAHEGYFSLALMPNLGGSGKVLLIAATGGSATSAAADFLVDERALQDLRGRLPGAKSTDFPQFEALVKTQGRSGAAREVSVVACRSVGK
jgi:hypothetical protein